MDQSVLADDVPTMRSSHRLLGLCCATYAAGALAIAPRDYSEFLAQYALMVGAALPLLILMATAPLAIAERPCAPVSGMVRVWRNAWPRAAITVVLFVSCITAFTTLKFNIPHVVPFYADPFLAETDVFLHGIAPWKAIHRDVPAWLAMLVEVAYEQVWMAEWFGLLVFVAFWGEDRGRSRYLWAFSLTMLIVGTILATLFSSVGPIFYDAFYDSSRFAGLLDVLNASDHAESYLIYANYLLASYESRNAVFGSGISAMPSMHVAIAVLDAWFLTSLSRRLALPAWSFAALILYGSVYSGWHYAVDGYVSIVVVTLIWWACSRLHGLPLNAATAKDGEATPLRRGGSSTA